MSDPVPLPKIISIIGPTASGKTSIAVEIASRFNGEIVSCDSVQIYQELNIGSAKPSTEEMRSIPHHLINILSPDTVVDAWKYKELAETVIGDILSRTKIPFLTGGTGMYFNSLYFGMFEGASKDEAIRARIMRRIEKEGSGPAINELKMIDPEIGDKILPNDIRRIVRALEVYYVTGTPISKLHELNRRMELDWLIIGLNPDRKALYERINARVDKMIEQGLIDETAMLMEKYGADAHSLQSIGYRHCVDFLGGKIGRDTMIKMTKQDTRHYAKRQWTWFRKIPAVRWFDPSRTDAIAETVSSFLKT
ncbi:MAG: tRNA (adenosine(37)-N6)-dimethylallyltransferase MiaA [Brevinematales bacterium]|nr:tRNA (adenosine(37)-N6)-dimethylallyltransferase MiaA [Brevinematales bacterium]